MSRARMLLVATALIGGPLSFATLPPDVAHAQCSVADQCSRQECRRRHDLVDQYCEQKRSCKKVSARNKPKLNLYLTRNEDCLGAREAVAECFSVTNKGHQDAIDQAEAAILTCRTKLDQ